MTADAAVVIVGMGPVGATLALLLGRAGVETVVIERDPAVVAFPRAVALDDEALRVLQAAGIDGDDDLPLLADRALRMLSAVGEPLVEMPPRRSVNGHPAVAFFDQPGLERELRSRLVREATVEVLLEHDMEGFTQEQDGVRVTVRDRRTATSRDLRAAWLIGCDGATGGVRRALGIRLRGFTSRRRWLVVDTRLRHPVQRAPFEFICDPDRPTVSAPLPGGLHRWEFMLLPGEDPNRMQRPAHARALVAQRADGGDFDVLRASAYAFHARVADRWGEGRVLLAGDAAHLSPPFAGLGLSSGLRDAHNLAWKLAAVTWGVASPALLSTYEAERRPDAARLIALAVALGALVQARRRPLVAARDAAISRAVEPASVRRWIAGGGWKPARTYRHGLVYPRRRRRRGEGSPFPQPVVRLPGGGERRLDDVLGAAFCLLAWNPTSEEWLDAESHRTLAGLGGRIVPISTGSPSSARSSGVAVKPDGDDLLERWFTAAGAPLALLRPDHHVYATFDPLEAPAVLAALGEWMRRR